MVRVEVEERENTECRKDTESSKSLARTLDERSRTLSADLPSS